MPLVSQSMRSFQPQAFIWLPACPILNESTDAKVPARLVPLTRSQTSLNACYGLNPPSKMRLLAFGAVL